MSIAAETTARAAADTMSLTAVRSLRERLQVLQEIDPILDADWQVIANNIFSAVDPNRRLYVERRILNPKGIRFNNETGKLVTMTVADVSTLQGQLRSPELYNLADQLLEIEIALRVTRTAHEFADLMESGISMIDRLEIEDDAEIAALHAQLRRSFIHDLVDITHKARPVMSENHRQLDWPMVQTFILQVYLRHQLSKLAFRAKPARALRDHPHEFIRNSIAPEAEIRKCLVRQSGDLIFLLGAPSDSSQNSFSIRRFVQEDSVMEGAIIYLNAIVMDRKTLDNSATQQLIEQDLARIITLEQNWGQLAMRVVTEMENDYENQVAPKLLNPIRADGSDPEAAISKLLLAFERDLSSLILKKFTDTVHHPEISREDLELLLISFRNIILNVATDIVCFNMLPIAAYSNLTEIMDVRIMSYLTLLDARAGHIGAPADQSATDAKAPQKIQLELIGLLQSARPQLAELEQRRQQLLPKAARTPGRLMRWLFAILKIENARSKLNRLERQIANAKHHCLVGLIRVFKQQRLLSLYVELEGLLPIDEHKRHYALTHGDHGLAQLPKIIRLYEDRMRLNIDAIEKSVNYDPLASKVWEDTRH